MFTWNVAILLGEWLCGVAVELRGYVFPRVGDALAVTHFPHYTSGVLTPYLFPEVGDTLPGTLLREYSGGLPLLSFLYLYDPKFCCPSQVLISPL